ncbi:MAG: YlxR family protein [Bacillota bacterium]|nr:YlxR family protein [Bacillota bacterium]
MSAEVLRMCVACRQLKERRQLIRLVRTPSGQVLIDDSGKQAGRGAYICRDGECLRKARKAKSLPRALKCAVDEVLLDEIAARIEERQ